MKGQSKFWRSGMARVFGRYLAILLAISAVIVAAIFALGLADISAQPEVTAAATTAATTPATTPPPTTPPTTPPQTTTEATTPEAKTVNVVVDGETLAIPTHASTVAELLAEAEIALGERDEVRPDASSDVYDGMCVTITRVVVERITAEIEIDFITETQESEDLYIGETEVLVEGQTGRKQIVFEQTIRDGVMVENRIVSGEIIVEPIARVLAVGTKPRPVTTKATKPATTPATTKATTKATTPKPTTAPTTTTKPGTVVSEPEAITVSVGGTTYGVKQVINGEAVAYYSKLANPSTATGNPAIPGKTIAVDPKVIPLGSLVYVTSVDGVSWSYGPAYAHDVGGGIKGNIIDLFKASYDECVAHGRRDCIIYILEP